MKKRIFALAAAVLMALAVVSAQSEQAEMKLTDVAIELYGSSVHYPKLEGSEEISRMIIEGAGIEDLISRMPMLSSSQTKLQVTWEGNVTGDVLSVVFHLQGNIAPNVHDKYVSVNIRLSTCQFLTLADVFSPDEQQLLLDFISSSIQMEMSPHCPVCDMSALPDDFLLSPGQVTLYYPMSRVTTLSERPGKVRAAFCEFLPEGSTRDESSPLGYFASPIPISRDDVLAAVSEGSFPGIPVSLGENVASVIEKYPLCEDPDLISSGRTLVVDDGEMRGCEIVTDRLTETFTSSVVTGIRLKAVGSLGLYPSKTLRTQVIDALGEPQSSVIIREDEAEMSRLSPGTSDYYQSGENRLRLHYTTDGVLEMAWMMK